MSNKPSMEGYYLNLLKVEKEGVFQSSSYRLIWSVLIRKYEQFYVRWNSIYYYTEVVKSRQSI